MNKTSLCLYMINSGLLLYGGVNYKSLNDDKSNKFKKISIINIPVVLFQGLKRSFNNRLNILSFCVFNLSSVLYQYSIYGGNISSKIYSNLNDNNNNMNNTNNKNDKSNYKDINTILNYNNKLKSKSINENEDYLSLLLCKDTDLDKRVKEIKIPKSNMLKTIYISGLACFVTI